MQTDNRKLDDHVENTRQGAAETAARLERDLPGHQVIVEEFRPGVVSITVHSPGSTHYVITPEMRDQQRKDAQNQA